MRDLNISIFDNDLGEFDEFNPRFVLRQNFVKRILTILSVRQPYYYNNEMIIKKLKITKERYFQTLNYLKNISAIEQKNDCLRLNFPFFNQKDVKIVKKIVKNEINKNILSFSTKVIKLSKELKKLYPNNDEKSTLYHILCGKVFDGSFFDFLQKENLLKMTYKKKKHRDYMLIGYRNNMYCNNFNANLLCSFNNARLDNNSLSSFGTPKGERLDYFRYFKLKEVDRLHGKFKKLDMLLNGYSKDEIMKNSFKIIENYLDNKQLTNNDFLHALKITRYFSKENKLVVPVFKDYIARVNRFSQLVYQTVGKDFANSLENIKISVINANITCLQHAVKLEELCNELWHIFFGLLSKMLIDKNLITKPKRYFWEGKYLKAIYLN